MTISLPAVFVALLGAAAAAPPQPANRFVLASVQDSQSEVPIVGLGAEDFVVHEGSANCDTVGARPASYPIAILVDTSQAARSEFSQMRKAVRQLIGRLSGRDIALYTFGDRAFRVVDYDRVFSPSGYYASLERLQRRLAAEVVVEYVSAGGDSRALRIGTRVPGATVRAIGLDRSPR